MTPKDPSILKLDDPKVFVYSHEISLSHFKEDTKMYCLFLLIALDLILGIPVALPSPKS